MPGTIGYSALDGTTSGSRGTASPAICNYTYSYTAVANDVIDSINVYIYVDYGTSSTWDIGIYDITSYPTMITAPLIYSTQPTYATQTAGETKVIDVSGSNWTLTAEHTYVLALAVTAGSARLLAKYSSSASVTDGNSGVGVALADPWATAAPNYSYIQPFWATVVESGATSIVPNTSNIMNMMRG